LAKTLILTGDVNLMNVADPAEPFRKIIDELYQSRPIYYGLGNLCFKAGHGGRQHANWIGMVAEVAFENGKCAAHTFRFVRHNEGYETVFCRPVDEAQALADLTARSKALGATLTAKGDRIRVAP
jgi:hypothetical protein